MKKNCEHCGGEFECARSTARFCSENCKKTSQRIVSRLVDEVEDSVTEKGVPRLTPEQVKNALNKAAKEHFAKRPSLAGNEITQDEAYPIQSIQPLPNVGNQIMDTTEGIEHVDCKPKVSPPAQGDEFHCTWPVHAVHPPMDKAEVRDRLSRIKDYNSWCKRNNLMMHYQWVHMIEENLLRWGADVRLAKGVGDVLIK